MKNVQINKGFYRNAEVTGLYPLTEAFRKYSAADQRSGYARKDTEGYIRALIDSKSRYIHVNETDIVISEVTTPDTQHSDTQSLGRTTMVGDLNVTAMECAVIDEIIHHEMSALNGSSPETYADIWHGTYCWADDFTSEVCPNVEQVKGVLSSLTKKGLVTINKLDDEVEGNTVIVTKLGYEAWKQTYNKRGSRGLN